MSGEIIEVCQECGHVIEPVTLTSPDGTTYEVTLCNRPECYANAALIASAREFRQQAAMRLDVQMWAYGLNAMMTPKSFRIEVTGL